MAARKIIPIRVPTPFAVGDVIVYLIKDEALTLIDCGRIQRKRLNRSHFSLRNTAFLRRI